MKFIVRNNESDTFEHRHMSDVQRIYEVMTSGGVETDLQTCAYIWDSYSDDYAAGWLGLPEEDTDLFNTIMSKAETMNHIKGFEL